LKLKIIQTVKPASYLWHLLSNFIQAQPTSNGYYTETKPYIGLIVGPGLAGGNMIAASSANKNFKKMN
jgi:hypothetical protein